MSGDCDICGGEHIEANCPHKRDAKNLTSVIISHTNEQVIKAARMLGVPLGRVQELIMSKGWQKEHKQIVSERVERLQKGKK